MPCLLFADKQDTSADFPLLVCGLTLCFQPLESVVPGKCISHAPSFAFFTQINDTAVAYDFLFLCYSHLGFLSCPLSFLVLPVAMSRPQYTSKPMGFPEWFIFRYWVHTAVKVHE